MTVDDVANTELIVNIDAIAPNVKIGILISLPFLACFIRIYYGIKGTFLSSTYAKF